MPIPTTSLTRDPVAVAVAGLGAMGRHHAAAVRRTPGLRLAALIDPVAETAAEAGAALAAPAYARLDDALAATPLEALIVSAPTSFHAPLVAAALDAGLDVLCEKPLALDDEDSHAMVRQAARSGRVFHVGLHRRFDPEWRAAVEAAHRGELGALTLLRLTQRIPCEPLSLGSLERNGTIYLDTTIHDLDAAVWAVGADPVEISAVGGRNRLPATSASHGHSDVAVVVLRFPGDVLAVVDNCFVAAYGFETSAELVGDAATVRFNLGGAADRLELLRDGRATRRLPLDHMQEHPRAYAVELEHFRDALHGSAPRLSCATEAVYAGALAQLAAAAQRNGGVQTVPSELRDRVTALTDDKEGAIAHG